MIYAIDLLDSLDKRHLVTPLLLAHDVAGRPRAGAARGRSRRTGAGRPLAARRRARAERPRQRRPHRGGAALAALRGEAAADVMRPFLTKHDPALAIAAAAALAASTRARRRRRVAEETLRRFSSDTREQGAESRLQVARALGDVKNPAFRPLLVPLMYDANLDVARAAIESAGTLGAGDFLFVPPLVSLLRNRRLKAAARAGAGRLRRGGRRAARLLHERPRGGHLGPPSRAVDAGAAAVPGVGRRADRRRSMTRDGFLRFKAATALDAAAPRPPDARDRSRRSCRGTSSPRPAARSTR